MYNLLKGDKVDVDYLDLSELNLGFNLAQIFGDRSANPRRVTVKAYNAELPLVKKESNSLNFILGTNQDWANKIAKLEPLDWIRVKEESNINDFDHYRGSYDMVVRVRWVKHNTQNKRLNSEQDKKDYPGIYKCDVFGATIALLDWFEYEEHREIYGNQESL
ncbi:hypothetical protein N9948_01575 [bacterium]|nr:hypothetical protein [bacterium]